MLRVCCVYVAADSLRLLYVQHQALEILSFGVVDVYRVVLRLVQLVEYPHFASHLRRCAEHRQTERLFVHRLRAGEGEQDTARTDYLYRLGVDTLVAAKRVLHGITVFGESGRVKDDEIIVIYHLVISIYHLIIYHLVISIYHLVIYHWVIYHLVIYFVIYFAIQEFEGVCGDGTMVCAIGEIALYVRFNDVYRFPAHIDRIDVFRSAAQGIKREPAGVTEHVQHLFACRITLH